MLDVRRLLWLWLYHVVRSSSYSIGLLIPVLRLPVKHESLAEATLDID
jgi:hypothetical protein